MLVELEAVHLWVLDQQREEARVCAEARATGRVGAWRAGEVGRHLGLQRSAGGASFAANRTRVVVERHALLPGPLRRVVVEAHEGGVVLL